MRRPPDFSPPIPPAVPPDGGAAPAVTLSGLGWATATLVCWTVTPLLVKYLTGVFDLWASNGWRYGMAALMWLPFLLWTIAKGKLPAGIWRRALWPAVFSAAAQVAFVGSFYFTGAGMVTFGLRFQIVATAIGACLFFPSERAIVRRPLFLIGGGAVIAGVIGVASLATPEAAGDITPISGSTAASPDRHTLGIVLAIVAGIGYACYGMAVRKCLAGVSARLSFSVISIYVGAAMILLMVLFADAPVAQLAAIDGTQWFYLILSVIFGLAAGHVIYFTAMTKLGVAPATGFVQLQPFTVAGAGYFVLGEVLNLRQIACGAVAVAGAGVMLYTQHAVSRRQRIDRMRTLDTLPVNEAVAMEEAELAGEEKRES
ncbi:MAG: DMT family transporter [Phycisphaerales bacterium]|nr:MAG: DMT family transporter [Phycisphaerales bacterium]